PSVERAVDRGRVADAVDEADDLLAGHVGTVGTVGAGITGVGEGGTLEGTELAGGGSQDHPFGDHKHFAVYRSGFHHATSRRRGTSLGVATLRVVTPERVRRASPERTAPGPTSRNVPAPSAARVSKDSLQRTGDTR